MIKKTLLERHVRLQSLKREKESGKFAVSFVGIYDSDVLVVSLPGDVALGLGFDTIFTLTLKKKVALGG